MPGGSVVLVWVLVRAQREVVSGSGASGPRGRCAGGRINSIFPLHASPFLWDKCVWLGCDIVIVMVFLVRVLWCFVSIWD